MNPGPNKTPKPTPATAALKIQEESSFVGPLPPPAILEQYSRIIPNGGERIMRLAEEESLHRRTLEIKVIDGGIVDDKARASERKRGQWFAFIIVVCTLLVAAFAVKEAHPVVGTIFGTGGVASVVAMSIYGSKRKPDNH
jgi:uncharacterized membrane protein